jgi:hypothetical protein
MNKIFASLVMGLVLIALGVLFLLNNLGVIWLEGVFIGASILFVLGVSFLLYLIADRSLWWPLIPSIILFTLSAIALLSYFDVEGEWLGSIFLWGAGLAFLAVYLKQKNALWSLITSWGFIVLGFIVLVEKLEEFAYWFDSGLGGSVLFLGGALAFLTYYIRKKKEWWPLFVSLILFTLAGVVAVAVVTNYGELAGSIFLWGAGLSFISIYIKKKDAWWAIIPGGISLVLGLFPMLAGFDWGYDILYAFIFFFGIGLVFAILSLVKINGQRLSWAMKPAFVLIGFSFFILIFAPKASVMKLIFSLFLLALGISLIIKYAVGLKKELT